MTTITITGPMRPYPQRPCMAPHCKAMRLASTHSSYCPGHRRAQARHGHVLQAPVTIAHLTPYLRTIKAIRKRNPDSPAWGLLADRWGRVADHAREVLAKAEAGLTFMRLERQAAELVVQASDSGDPQEIVSMALAVYLLRDAEPSRFADERSFRFVLTRRIRKLTPMAVASYWNHKAGRMVGVYRDPPPRVTAVLGDWLAECFGPGGLQLAQLERQRAQKLAQEGARLADALGSLQ